MDAMHYVVIGIHIIMYKDTHRFAELCNGHGAGDLPSSTGKQPFRTIRQDSARIERKGKVPKRRHNINISSVRCCNEPERQAEQQTDISSQSAALSKMLS